jgi:hypothetical protein
MKNLSWIAATIFFLSIGILSGIHGSLVFSFLSLVLLTAFLVTALPVSRLFFKSNTEAIVMAFPIGFVVHTVLLTFAAKIFGINRGTLLIYFITAAATFIYFSYRRKTKSENDWHAEDNLLLFVWLILTIAIVSIPFFKVGIETPAGFAYRAYFDADFFRNMAVTGSISHTGLPPDNPYFGGHILRYYWFFHLLISFWKTIFPSYRLDFLLVQFSLAACSMFSASLFLTLRRVVHSRKALITLFFVFAFGGSYKGIYLLSLLGEKSWMKFKAWNVEGILRWSWNVPQIDTLYRAMLFAPQHLIALCIFFVFILARNTESKFGKVLLFVLILSTLGFSAFIGGLLILSCGFIVLFDAVRNLRSKWWEILAYGVLGITFLLIYLKLFQMFELLPQHKSSQKFIVGANYFIFKHLPAYLILNWGAILLAGIAGIFLGVQQPSQRFLLLYFLVICLFFIVFTKLDLPGSSDISLKVGYLTHIVLLLLSANFINYIYQASAIKRKLLIAGLIVLILPSFVSWSMDAYNSQDIKNAQFTTYVSKSDAVLFGWMRNKLPSNAIVQNYPKQGGYLEEYVNEVPPFAERSVYLGDKNFARIFQIDKPSVDHRFDVVSQMFQENSGAKIAYRGRQIINYIFLSSSLAKTAPWFESMLQEPFFTLAHQEGKSFLFKINKVEPKPKDLEQPVLLEENHVPIVTAHFVRNFYAPELQEISNRLFTVRWMYNNGIISLEATRPVAGKIQFVTYSLGHDRTAEIYLNGAKIHQTPVLRRRFVVSFPLELAKGTSQLEIRCVEGAESAERYDPRAERRLVSIKLVDLKFIPD